jgi:chaperonin GroEL
MSLFQTNKPKSAGKVMVPPGEDLSDLVLSTLKDMANMAGATLGPLGRQLLLERPEMELKPIVTKDGVTVIKHMGYSSAVQQLVLEAARDAAIQTAADAGDGTTTATILSYAIAARANKATQANPNISPQAIIREMKNSMPYILEAIDKYKIKIDEDNFYDILKQVAKVSGNADE